ncbi:MAG: sigma-70 family RNA polymerase sigma factor [Flammeovirgaceae bacterium]|nr:sigma-70 family RNA polymerase sigma factor [Flammeovirgaceae bacterium]
MEEQDLVKGLLARDKSFFSYLYDHYSGALYGVILRILKNEDVAEEVLQDVFLKIWDRIESYDAEKGKLFTWMVNITRNQAIDKTRSKEFGKGKKTGTIENSVHAINTKESVETSIEGIGVKELLIKLPEEQRFVIEQHYLNGYTQSEIAKEFNLPLGTVKTRMRMAMQELRSLIGNE